MATLTFELLARRFVYNRGLDYSQKRLLFEAAVFSRDELNVLNKGQLTKGDVTFITEPHEHLIATLKYLDAWEDSDKGTKNAHSFSLAAVSGNEIFDTLMSVDLKANQVYLTFDTDILDSGLTYGYDPDGSEKVWDLEKEDPLKAESFTIVIKGKDEAEEGEGDPEFEHQESPSQPLTVTSDPQMLKQLRAIWWTILVLGTLILMKLSW